MGHAVDAGRVRFVALGDVSGRVKREPRDTHFYFPCPADGTASPTLPVGSSGIVRDGGGRR